MLRVISAFRALSAIREWLELRARVREEYRYHLHCATADLRSLGLSPREARRSALSRYGRCRQRRAALREIGGDPAGLARLFRVHRVIASVWLQPALLLAAVIMLVLLSPSPVVLLESLAGRPLTAESARTVFFSTPAPWPLFTGITSREFETIRSLPELSRVERDRQIYVRAVADSTPLAAIGSEVRRRTGNPGIYAMSQFEQTRIETRPAIVVWVIIALTACFSLKMHLPAASRGRWLAYAALLGFLHMLTSVTAWAFAIQLWKHPASGLALGVFLVAYLLASGMQYRFWLRDLYQRCPVCLERLLLTLTQGRADHLFVTMPFTESVCAHGHGVLTESPWARRFETAVSSF